MLVNRPGVAEIFRECSPPTMCHMSGVICHMSSVTFQVSGVRCHVSGVTIYIYTYFFSSFSKEVELDGGGYVTNVHQKRGSGGQFRFIHALPMYPTFLEALGPKEI